VPAAVKVKLKEEKNDCTPESKRPIPEPSVTDWAAGPANSQLIALPSWSRGGSGSITVAPT